jgi:recombination protein RecA
LDLAIKADLVQKSGSWYSIGDERLGQGAKTAMEAIKGLGNEFLDKIDKWLEDSGYSTYNEEVEEAEKIIEEQEEANEPKKVRGRKKKSDTKD